MLKLCCGCSFALPEESTEKNVPVHTSLAKYKERKECLPHTNL
ncbi:hypothetical protein E2C01_009602 [Portunus trituberculatus]|uniref:Uncharacterized protein n=1 Tax=Portunus trituberculatus TaxID=210409 RepID=A0A5B7D6F6_PORTR|nr:hypothetical protein [Portunus trituberculatus]